MKKTISVVAVIVAAALITVTISWVVVFCQSTRSREGSPIESSYYMDDQGNFAANIHRENYLYNVIAILTK